MQPRGNDARRIDDEQVAGRNQRREIVEMQMPCRTGAAVEHEQPARRAVGERVLRDLLLRQVVVEVGEVH